MTELHDLTAAQLARGIRAREFSPLDVVEALLKRAAAVDPKVLAWETLDAEGARMAARAAETALASAEGPVGPLHGVPFGVKDIFDTAGLRTSASFPPYQNRVPREDAAVVEKLKRAGALVLGKTVTTQFAQSDPPRTRNPWSAGRTPGGSSSGSGAGVAARLMPFAIGSQTAGSVLRPAAYNGVVGFKPTYGRVSKRGAFPLAWSLDTVGVLARGVEDCALWLEATAGQDPRDPTTFDAPLRHVDLTGSFPPHFGLLSHAIARSQPEVAAHVQEVARRFEAAGAEVREVAPRNDLDLILAVHHVVMQTEAAAVHWQLLEQFPGQHGPRLRAYAEVGRLLPGAAYVHAQRVRARIVASMRELLDGVDVLLLPTAVNVAPTPETTGDTSLQAPFSLAGFPSISLPSGLSSEGLPFAIQLVAGPREEADLLAAAKWCEQQLGPMPAPPL